MLKNDQLNIAERNTLMKTSASLSASFEEAMNRNALIKRAVDEMLKDGVDYGKIEGFHKSTLLKPGAEKLCDIFGFAKLVNIVNRNEDWEKGVFAYEVKVTLISKQTGTIEAEGIGSCNSKEQTYTKQDSYNVVNTILKMAKKRALIDAVLTATRSSEFFTQDTEYMNNALVNLSTDDAVTDRQLHMIHKTISDLSITKEIAKQMIETMFNVDHSTKLSKKQASILIKNLVNLKEKKTIQNNKE